MNNFVQSTSQYFRAFLETDFRKRRLPKRSLKSSDKSGNKITLNLNKYTDFKKNIIKLLNDKSVYDFEIPITEKQYTTKIDQEASRYLLKKVIGIKNENKDKITKLIQENISALILEHIKDIPLLYEEFVTSLCGIVEESIIDPALESIEGTVDRSRGQEYTNFSSMREELSELLIMKHSDDLRNKLDLHLENPEKFDLSNLFEEILSDQNITSALNSYLDSFNLTDLFNDLTSLIRVKKIKDNLEIYLNLGLVETNNTFFPITFIPVDVQDTYSNKKRVLKICFEKKLFVNKHALEYCFQAMHNDRNVASISSSVERVVNIEENETILSTIRDLLAKVCPLFNIDPHFFDSLEKSNKATSGILKMHNNMNLNVFDKGDESAINDYEELLDFLEDDEGIAEEFTEIVDNFIKEDPKNINTDVDSYWKEKDVSERLVHPSPIPVNEEQRKILISSKSKEGKYISVQGPPGTGKSHTISAILFDAIVDGRSVLMLSDKKEALDVVEDKLTEVLNTVRPDKNFQNPILRIGKSGNTYAKILSAQSTEQIKTAYEATNEILKERKNNLKDEVDGLRKDINEHSKAYEDIDYKDIARYMILKNNDEIKDIDSEHINNSKDIKDEIKLLEKCREIFNQLTDGTKSLLSKYEAELQSVDGYKQQIDVARIIHKSLSEQKNKGLNIIYRDISFEDKALIDSSLKEIRSVKDSFFKNILAKYLLKDCNLELNRKLKLVGDTDFIDRFDILEKSSELLSNLKSALDANHIAEKISHELLSNLFSDTKYRCIETDYNHISELESSIAEYIRRSNKNSELIKDYKISQYKDFLRDEYDSHISKHKTISDFLVLGSELHEKFGSLENIRYFDRTKDINQDAALEMTQNFDSRFLKFAYNHSSTARAFKKIITKKLRFPKDEFSKLKDAFPCIISGIRDYADYIPLQKDLFDLLIIDEASQVSVAQAFPAVLRAKKVIILGDNKQFSNVKAATASSDQNNTWLQTLKTKFNESYGKENELQMQRANIFNVRNSILEFFDYFSNYRCTLKKHFRGYPEIISFSSQYFYDGALQAIKIRAKPIEDVIEFDQIEHDGLIDHEGNLNKIEAEHIVNRLEDICQSNENISLGVITPFRDQQKYILSLVDKSVHREKLYKNNKIKIMTFDSCQGEERDHIFYSMVEHINTKVSICSVLGRTFDMSYMDPENNLRLQRLNVGMSRAKEKITFVLSKSIEDFSGNGLLILNHYKQQVESSKNISNIDKLESPMEEQVLSWIKQTKFFNQYHENIELIPQFDIGKYLKMLNPMYDHPKYRCDFLLIFNKDGKTKNLIIEYDGFEFHFQRDSDINKFNYNHYYSEKDVERERILESYGFPFLRLNKFNVKDNPVQFISDELDSFFLPSH